MFCFYNPATILLFLFCLGPSCNVSRSRFVYCVTQQTMSAVRHNSRHVCWARQLNIPCGPPWAFVGRAFVGPLGPCWASWPPCALVGLGPCGPPWGLVGCAIVALPGPLWARPLWAPHGPFWAGPSGLPFALAGRTLAGPRGPLWVGPH